MPRATSHAKQQVITFILESPTLAALRQRPGIRPLLRELEQLKTQK